MTDYRMGENGMPVPTDERGMPQPAPLTAGQCRHCGYLIVHLNVGWAVAGQAFAEYPLRCPESKDGHKPITKPPALTDRKALEAWLDD